MKLKRYRKLNCAVCSPKKQKIVDLGKKHKVVFPYGYVKTQHELSLTTYYPRVRYRCLTCGEERWVIIPSHTVTKTKKGTQNDLQ